MASYPTSIYGLSELDVAPRVDREWVSASTPAPVEAASFSVPETPPQAKDQPQEKLYNAMSLGRWRRSRLGNIHIEYPLGYAGKASAVTMLKALEGEGITSEDVKHSRGYRGLTITNPNACDRLRATAAQHVDNRRWEYRRRGKPDILARTIQEQLFGAPPVAVVRTSSHAYEEVSILSNALGVLRLPFEKRNLCAVQEHHVKEPRALRRKKNKPSTSLLTRFRNTAQAITSNMRENWDTILAGSLSSIAIKTGAGALAVKTGFAAAAASITLPAVVTTAATIAAPVIAGGAAICGAAKLVEEMIEQRTFRPANVGKRAFTVAAFAATAVSLTIAPHALAAGALAVPVSIGCNLAKETYKSLRDGHGLKGIQWRKAFSARNILSSFAFGSVGAAITTGVQHLRDAHSSVGTAPVASDHVSQSAGQTPPPSPVSDNAPPASSASVEIPEAPEVEVAKEITKLGIDDPTLVNRVVNMVYSGDSNGLYHAGVALADKGFKLNMATNSLKTGARFFEVAGECIKLSGSHTPMATRILEDAAFSSKLTPAPN